MNLTLSIGRNVGTTPLGVADWRAFRGGVDLVARGIVDAFPRAQIVQSGTVDGWWDGAHEESYTITVADVRPSRRCKRRVNAQISALCKVYRQDAIASTWYKPSLIK